MLRTVLVVLGVSMLIAAAFIGWPAIALAVFGAVLVLGLLFERYVYKPVRPDPPGPGWQQTGERFADPRSGGTVVVYFNPRTGERRYVAESGTGLSA